MSQIFHKCDSQWLFQIRFQYQYILARQAEMYLNRIWKNPGFVPLDSLWAQMCPARRVCWDCYLNEADPWNVSTTVKTRDDKFYIQFGPDWPQTGHFKISFSIFSLAEPKCTETYLKKSQICPIYPYIWPYVDAKFDSTATYHHLSHCWNPIRLSGQGCQMRGFNPM